MHMEQMLRQMNEMRLTSMAAGLQERLRSGDHHDLSHEEFLSLLIEDEYSARRSRKLTRTISRANFKPEQACFENLRYSPARGLLKKDVSPYSGTSWIDNNQLLVITGATGTGKTYLAEAIGLRACINGYTAMKYRFRKLLDDIASARGTGTYPRFVSMLDRMKVLIVDDFVICPADKKQCSDLLELLDDREQRGPLIITSQYGVDEWHDRFTDPTMADAICDRLIHGSHKINLFGPSLRKPQKSGSN